VNATADMTGIRPVTVHQHLTRGTIPTPEIWIGNPYAWRRRTIEPWRTRLRPDERRPVRLDGRSGL
jgi:hypothetical protein